MIGPEFTLHATAEQARAKPPLPARQDVPTAPAISLPRPGLNGGAATGQTPPPPSGVIRPPLRLAGPGLYFFWAFMGGITLKTAPSSS